MRRIQAVIFGLALALTALTWVSSARAQVDIPQGPLVNVSLVSEKAAVAPGQSIWVALRMEIHPGWHTYWRNAGDAGAEAELDWQLPEGITADPISWPMPYRMPEGPLMTFAYEGEILLPIKITVSDDFLPGQSVTLAAEAKWLVCDEICIPEDGDVELTLSVANVSGSRTEWTEQLLQTVAQLPTQAPWPVNFFVGENALHLLIEAPELNTALTHAKVHNVTFFPYQQKIIHNPAEQVVGLGEEGFSLSMQTAKRFKGAQEIAGILVFEEEIDTGPVRRGFEFTAQPSAAAALSQQAFGVGQALPITSSGSDISLLKAALFAFLGGIILNVMPCVFPILFIKALGFMSAASGPARTIRNQGLAYTVGVLLSFVALSLVLIALRAGGAQIGWGFQLQSPLIVSLLALLMLAVALSLSGVFTIAGGWTNIGSSLAAMKGNVGSFFTGVLATIVATPCTAPFMGVAMGFALVQPAPVALTIFASLGFGMASPYLALSFFPAAARALPKPGPWMERAQQFLAFPMYGTAAWLAWVVSQQVATTQFFGLMVALILFAFAAWAFGASQGQTGKWAMVGRVIALVSLISVAVFLSQLKPNEVDTSQPPAGEEMGLAYKPYSAQTLAALRAEGKPVFVNFTASWCISCLVNERVALSRPDVEAALDEHGITYFKADWTNRDAKIAKALAEFDRAGVPLYLYYPSGGREAQVLPQILTESILLEVFRSDGKI